MGNGVKVVPCRRVAVILAGVAIGFGSPAGVYAGQSGQQVDTSYSYDALGRLVKSVTTCPGRSATTDIEYDAAGNRKTYRSQGPGCGRARFVVVPLNGFTLIPIR